MASTYNYYQTTWLGKGDDPWEYRLTMFPADTVDIDHDPFNPPQTNTMPDGCMTSVKIDWERDTGYPLGLYVKHIQIEFNMELVDADFNEFIVEPFADQSFEYDTPSGWSGDSFTMEFPTANVFKLEIKFVGNDSYGGPDWRTVYIGTQRNGIEDGYDPVSKTFTIETQSIIKSTLESFRTEWMHYLYQVEDVYGHTRVLNYWLYRIHWGSQDKNLAFMGYPANDEPENDKYFNGYFWMYDWNQIDTYITDVADQIYKKFMRDDSAEGFDIVLPFPTYYKQHNGSATGPNDSDAAEGNHNLLGDPITLKSDLYVCGHITNKPKENKMNASFYGGWLYSGLTENYDTMWAYCVDLWKEGVVRGYYDEAENILTYTQILPSSAPLLNLEGSDLSEPMVFPHSEVLNRVSASFIEVYGENNDNYELTEPSNRTDAEMDIRIIHSTIPPASVDGSHVDGGSGTYHGRDPIAYRNMTDLASDGDTKKEYVRTFDTLEGGVYYSDTVGDVLNDGQDVMRREGILLVHEFVTYNMDGTIDSDNYVENRGQDITPEHSVNRNIADGESYEEDVVKRIAESYADKGKAYVLAHTILNLYNDPLQTRLTGTVSIKNAVNYTLAPNWGANPWMDTVSGFTFDLNELAPDNNPNLFDNYPTAWLPVKVEIDCINEVVSFEAISIKDLS